jgi:hypothetical protein
MSEPGWKTNMDNHNMESLARLHRRVRELETASVKLLDDYCLIMGDGFFDNEITKPLRALLKDRS